MLVDKHGNQPRSFDGAFADTVLWPRFPVTQKSQAVPIDSVTTAVEIKSSLNAQLIQDIQTKALSLLDLQFASSLVPPVAAFSYSGTNPELSFWDYCALRQRDGHSASVVCVLNRCVFTLVEQQPSDDTRFALDGTPHALPVFISSGEDSLLLFIYIITSWITRGTGIDELFVEYLEPALQTHTVFSFDEDFLRAGGLDEGARTRDAFRGSLPMSIKYAKARDALGLEPISGRMGE